MDQNIRLGKISGIPVGVNWSVLAIFALIVWELAELVLPSYNSQSSANVYWTVGVFATILFFVSLLAHEASHSVVAKRNGIGVRRITLWLFGGVSELESEALTSGADFRIAVAGPLTSFAFAVIFGVMRLLLLALGIGSTMASALGWLAWMNVMLAGFNMLPGAPLDGGRVLRAYLWHRNGDRLRAATTAARAGQVLGYILVAMGILEFFGGAFAGLWLVFLGWFLLSAAHSEQNSAVMRSSLAGVHVRDIMTPNPATFDSTATVADLLDSQLQHFRFNSYPLVAPDGRLDGLVTTNRIRHLSGDLRPTTQLHDIACPLADVPIGSPGEPIPELLQRMEASLDGRALVVDDTGNLVGIVSPSDIARYVQLAMLRSQGRSARGT